MKLFNRSDSDSWSFEDSDVEMITNDSMIDNGRLQISEDQAARKYDAATKLAFGKRSTPALTMAKHMELVKNHGKTSEEKKSKLEKDRREATAIWET